MDRVGGFHRKSALGGAGRNGGTIILLFGTHALQFIGRVCETSELARLGGDTLECPTLHSGRPDYGVERKEEIGRPRGPSGSLQDQWFRRRLDCDVT